MDGQTDRLLDDPGEQPPKEGNTALLYGGFGAAIALAVAILAVLALDGGSGGSAGDANDRDAASSTTTAPAERPADPSTPEADGDGAAPAAAGECVTVSPDGVLTGVGSCEPPGVAPYRVVEIVDRAAACTDPNTTYVVAGEGLLCLEANLNVGSCYVLPTDADGNFEGWITEAPECRAPGTIEVVDVVPDARTPDGCAGTEHEDWTRWYWFGAPLMVACVVHYD